MNTIFLYVEWLGDEYANLEVMGSNTSGHKMCNFCVARLSLARKWFDSFETPT